MTTRLSLCVSLIFLSFIARSAAAADRPNVIFIMSDDHTSQALGCYGSRLAGLNPTPNLDQLAAEGMRFENAFCTNSICTPSRACILTGQYNHVNGVYDLGGRIEPENQHLAHAFSNAGYQTAMIGKWHLKAEPAAFDFYTVLPGQGKYFDPVFRIAGEKPWPKNTFVAKGKHSSDAITDITLEWLKTGRDPDKPFFLMHHYKAPHDFFEYAPRYEDYLANAHIPEPGSLWSDEKSGSVATRGVDDELRPHIGTSIGRRNPRRNYAAHYKISEDLSDAEAKRAAYQIYLKHYLRCVKGVDDNVGRLFAYLKEAGLMDNTLIVYTGDQGFVLGEHDYMDKRWMYEECLRMPFLMRLPGTIPAGAVTDALVENVDYGPTMLALCGIDTPDMMQGRSFAAVARGEANDHKEATYYRYWMHMAHHDNPGHVGIRTKTHKLIFFYGCDYKGEQRTPPGWELYDLVKDPEELSNEYDNPDYASVVSDLKNQLRALRREVGDTGEDYPEVEAIIEEFWDYDPADREKLAEISRAYRATREAAGKRRYP